jgi:predicted TIM-barrel fold metal-dependent hydrolase
MGNTYSVKVDAYSHVLPPEYGEFVREAYPEYFAQICASFPTLYDMEERFRIMDRFGQVLQVLTLGPIPPIEEFAEPDKTVELARMVNDGIAELVLKHRDRFLSGIATLPLNDIEASLKEADRAINDLGLRGIYLHTNILGKPLDAPEFLPLFQKMSEYNLPIYVHPWRSNDVPDYPTETETKYAIASTFGWPYDTTAMMTRLVFSRMFDKFPNLKVVTHHCGGMVPYYEQRIVQHYSQTDTNLKFEDYGAYMRGLAKTPIEYYKMFYADTAIHGNTPALMLAYHFFGADHIVFGADMPLGDRFLGFRSYRQTINAIEAMEISDEEKYMIFAGNVQKLLRVTV